MSVESELNEFLASGKIPYNFSLHYTDYHTLWGGTTITISGRGRSVKQVLERWTVNPQVYEIEINAEQLKELAALLIELKAWEQIMPQSPLVPDEALASLKITIGNPRGGIWERFKEMAANQRLIRIKDKMNSLFDAVEPNFDGNIRPDDLEERNKQLAKELLETMQSSAPDEERLEYEAVKDLKDKAALEDYYQRTGQLNQKKHIQYCNELNKKGLTCKEDNLLLIRWLEDEETSNSESVVKIFQCRACHGLYKYKYSSRYESHKFDVEEGWYDYLNRYFKVEEEYVQSVPLPYEEALQYGYNGQPVNYANERCANPPDFSGLTCCVLDVVQISGAIYDSIKKCRKCGEFYKQVWFRNTFPSTYYHYKPNENYRDQIAFPLNEALQYGYIAKYDT